MPPVPPVSWVNPATGSSIQRSTLQLYRDCMRLVRHIAPGESSPKSIALRTTIRNDFRSKKFLTNEIEIENAKASAVRALSNFLLANSAPKDPKVHSAMKDFHGRSVQDAKNHNATTNDSDNNNQQERQQKE